MMYPSLNLGSIEARLGSWKPVNLLMGLLYLASHGHGAGYLEIV